MNTVTDLPELCPRVVSNRAEIERLRWFQQNRYFEAGIIDVLPTTLPPDQWIDHSTYFGVYADEDIQATARIVRSSGGQLPILEHHQLFPAFTDLVASSIGSVAEISRLAVGLATPHYRSLSLLSREFLRFGMRDQSATLLVASVEKPLVRIMNRVLSVPVQIIGPPIDQFGDYNGETVPIMIDTIQCLRSFQLRDSRRWEFFVEGLVIDLTDDRKPSLPLAQSLSQVAS